MPLRALVRRRPGIVHFAETLAGRRDVPDREPHKRTYRLSGLDGPAIRMDPATGLVTIDVAFSVDRPFEEVRDLLDPRYWDLGGKYFHPDGTYLRPSAHPKTDRCRRCGKSRTATEDDRLAIGGDWSWQVLYEHFHGSDASGFDVSFDNLLWVNPDRLLSPEKRRLYVVTYALHKSLAGRTDYVESLRFERDDGDVSAEELAPEETRVHMRKRIRFRNEWANVSTYIAYKYVGADTARDLLGVVSAELPSGA
jgi:hypothetical protein